MVKPDLHTRGATSFAVTVLSLIVVAATLGGLLYWLLKSAGQSAAGGDQQKYLANMAALTTATLLLTLLLLAYLVTRRVVRRLLANPDKPKTTPYVNAWLEAGRRLRPQDAPPVPGFEDPGDGNGDGLEEGPGA